MTLQALKDLRVEGWKSQYSSVDNVLRHLKRKTASSGSVELYADTLSQLCRFTSMDPDQLVSLQPSRIEGDIHAFLDSLQERGLSLKTISTRRSYLLLHFRINGFKAEKALDLEVYHVPARYRKLPEYIPSPAEIFKMADAAPSTRDRAVVLCLYSSGLRESTLKALRYKDVKDELNNEVIFVPVYPEMKRIHPKACKNSIPYYTFFCREATEALRAYLRDREAKYGPIVDGAILFPPSPREAHLTPEKATFKTLAKNGLNSVLKRAARSAGIQEWIHIHPHCLRKAFEGALRSRNGRTIMDVKTQEFLMGHMLPGSQDPYFGSGVHVEGSNISFNKEKVEEIRKEYSRLNFSPNPPSVKKEEAVLEAIRRFAEAFGVDPMRIRIEKQKELGREPDTEEEILAIQNEIKKLREPQKDPQMLVKEEELESYIKDGWQFVSVLPSQKILIRK